MLENTESEKVIIISHGDCDGVCSAAIALMSYKYADILFTQPYALSGTLNDEKVTHANTIVILDLAINETHVEKLLRFTDKYIVVIDHHKQSLSYSPLFGGMIDTSMSASMLTSIYYQIPTILSIIGMIGDKLILTSKKDRLFTEAELIRESISYDIKDDDFRVELTKLLAEGHLPSEIDEVVRRSVKSNERKIKLMDICENRINNFNNFIFIDARDLDIEGKVSSIAGSLSIKYKLPVFILFKTSSGETILTSRAHSDSSIDLNKIMSKFGGGGHKHAASARVNPDTILEKIKSLIR